MKHEIPKAAVHVYRDEFGIGQVACARNRRDVARDEMRKHVTDAFTRDYRNPEWRAAHKRLFRQAVREYMTALDVLAYHKGATQ